VESHSNLGGLYCAGSNRRLWQAFLDQPCTGWAFGPSSHSSWLTSSLMGRSALHLLPIHWHLLIFISKSVSKSSFSKILKWYRFHMTLLTCGFDRDHFIIHIPCFNKWLNIQELKIFLDLTLYAFCNHSEGENKDVIEALQVPWGWFLSHIAATFQPEAGSGFRCAGIGGVSGKGGWEVIRVHSCPSWGF
jgi:hypothetical protein